MKANLILFTKARGWWSPQHGGTHVKRAKAGEDGGHEAGSVASSADIKTLAEAQDYWKRNFEDHGPHDITVKYRKKNYHIVVTFERNHAYTQSSGGSKADADRVFDPDRAVLMDHIWDVLARPSAISLSPHGLGRKQYDSRVTMDGVFGRVILEPKEDMRDEKSGILEHYRFVSWHPVSASQYHAAASDAKRKLIKPTDDSHTMEKALPDGRAFSPITEPFSPLELGASPASEGWAFNHSGTSRSLCYRKSVDSERRTGRTNKDSLLRKSVKPSRQPRALDTGARVLFITDRI